MANKNGCHRDGIAQDVNMFGWIKRKSIPTNKFIF